MCESNYGKSIVVSTVLALGTLFFGCSSEPEVSNRKILSQAREALRQSDFEVVQKLANRISIEASEWQDAQLLAGEAAQKGGNAKRAIEIYLSLAEHDKTTPDGQAGLFYAAELYLGRGELSQAEPLYREVLHYQPGNGLTHQRMAMLLSITGRRWEALDHYYVLVKGGNADYLELGITADIGRHIEQHEFLQQCQSKAPEDPLVRLAAATHAFNEGLPATNDLLRIIVSQFPKLISAQAMLGELIVEAGDIDAFLEWHFSLPDESHKHPDIWFVRGLWARKQGELSIAAECFWQAVIRAPFHRRAYYNLGQTLVTLEDPRSQTIVDYSKQLIDLSQSIDRVLVSKGHREDAVRETTRLLNNLGRTWEVCAWGVLARKQFPNSTWPDELLNQHAHKLSPELPRIDPKKNPTFGLTLSPVPEFTKLCSRQQQKRANSSDSQQDAPLPDSKIHFEQTELINFVYDNAHDPATKGARTFEQTGGGVAIIDYDLNGQPDVFLPQGTAWKTGEESPSLKTGRKDQLYRNHHGRSFVNSTFALTGADSGYGQGCSVGDFNNDGFPDLYVANVGRNCLYQNMGDGTFTQVSDIAGLTNDSWTTSVMVCDLNADGLPDLFDVNYLEGENLYTRICQGYACSPINFPGAPDVLWLNQGDGTFHQLADATPQSESKGLGVVAFELTTPRRPVLFIANDQVANYFLDNQPSSTKDNVQLTDKALLSGVAYDENGISMACMGIALDDWDRNNRLDLFVTNFHNEPNTLYVQDYSELFVDTTKSSGLYTPSIPMTGWGTQSLDANLDGYPDLVIVNGHVDDYRDKGGPYQMSPQFFQNHGDRFQELKPDDVGDWFRGKYLGRGLARVDWNLDGKPEFIVSNINSPVAVLKNSTTSTGHHLTFRLHATKTARDAIGTRVIVRSGGQVIERQLVAGDGYMASNERVIQFGLGRADRVDEVEIAWPSGNSTFINSPPLDSLFHIVEESNSATTYSSGVFDSVIVHPMSDHNHE